MCVSACGGLRLTLSVFLNHSLPYILKWGLCFDPNLTSLATWVAPEMWSLPPPSWPYGWSTRPTQVCMGAWIWILVLILHCQHLTCQTISPAPSCPPSKVVLLSCVLIILLPGMEDVLWPKSAEYLYTYAVSLGFPKLLLSWWLLFCALQRNSFQAGEKICQIQGWFQLMVIIRPAESSRPMAWC